MITEIIFLFFIFILLFAFLYYLRNSVITGGYREVVIENANDKNKIEYYDDTYKENSEFFTKSNIYKDINSNEQISTVIKYGSASEYSRLVSLLGKHINLNGFKRSQFLNYLLTQKDKIVYDKISKQFTRNEITRSESQARELFRPLFWYLKLNIKPEVLENLKYLDIGCNNGEITNNIRKLLNAKEAHCLEVNKDMKHPDVKYKYIEENNYKLDYENDYFDVVTAFMSLHHVRNLDNMLDELYRIIKPGGLLFIKEHDTWNAIDSMLVDIEHAVFMYHNKEDFKSYYCVYRNYFGWDQTLKKYFKYIKSDYFYTSVRNEISPTRAWWGIYKKL